MHTYIPGVDGTDETFDIYTPDGEFLVSVPYWEDAARAEAVAKLLVDALNTREARLLEALETLVDTVERQKGINKAQIKPGSPLAIAHAAIAAARGKP